MKYIGYSELTRRYYILPRSKKESKVDITDDIKEIIVFENSKNINHNFKSFCDAAGHYGASPLTDNVCPKCGKKYNHYEETPSIQEGEERPTRTRGTKYTYYQVDFQNCSAFDGDYMICESIEEIKGLLESVDINLDDPESGAIVEIKGIGMTPVEYEEWIKENI